METTVKIDYRTFVPDARAEDTVRAALAKYYHIWTNQNRPTHIPPVLMKGLIEPDPRYVYEHAARFARDHGVLLYAAEEDSVPIFRLLLEGLGEQPEMGLEFFVHIAAIYNAGNVIRYLASRGADINFKDEQQYNHTPLHWAVYQHSTASVTALLEQPGIELDLKDSSGNTPLKLAIGRRRPDIADQLIAAGAQLTTEMLVQAAGMVNDAMIDFVIRHAPDLNVLGSKGLSPLHMAVSHEHTEGARRLLAAGADPKQSSKRMYRRGGHAFPRGSTAIDMARILGKEELAAVFEGRA